MSQPLRLRTDFGGKDFSVHHSSPSVGVCLFVFYLKIWIFISKYKLRGFKFNFNFDLILQMGWNANMFIKDMSK